MAAKPLPSQEVLRQLLRYEPETGKLFWRERSSSFFIDGYRTAEGQAANWNSRFAGQEAFTSTDARGCRTGRINDQLFRAHRVIWALVYGSEPEEVDHINGDPSDNRLTNLREVDHNENCRNMAMSSRNKSGVTGVFLDGASGLWRVEIRADGRTVSVGRFGSKRAAMAARKAAEIEHGYHPNHGRRRSS